MLWNKNSPAFLGIPMDADQRRRAFSALEASGAILPIRIEGSKTPFYFRAEDEALMQETLAERLDRKPRLEFLAPLDPLLWDKAMIAALWDFSYAWEIYTPAEKRKYGAYTLPILWGEHFIGRIDMAADHRDKVLRVRRIWFEPGVRLTKTMGNALDRSLIRFARFNGCTKAERL